jgi:sensor histidine kinase YesM
VKNQKMIDLGGQCRRVVYTPGQSTWAAMRYTGEYQIQRSREEEKTVTLQISDDGRGMPEKFVEMINSNDFSSVPEGRHIGIRNSINRLQYYYEGKATVSVESVPQGGTTFTITIPQELITE